MSDYDTRTGWLQDRVERGMAESRLGTQADAIYCVALALTMIFDQFQGVMGVARKSVDYFAEKK